MTFSKEDKAAWNDSEIMQHLEKIAKRDNILNGPPKEAFQPIVAEDQKEDEEENEKIWEEEEINPESKERTDEMVRDEDLKKELEKVYSNNLIKKLNKISGLLASNSQIQTAYRIERALNKIKEILEV